MVAEIICVGTELLLGDILNTNVRFLSREMSALGISVYYQTVCGDNALRLAETLALALSRADIVITTGGLGPTADDLTKETVAAAFGREMLLHEPSLARIKAFFARIDRPCTQNNEKQALMPAGAIVFDNDYGTAPALALEEGEKCVIMLPGPPREMEGLWHDKIFPFLSRRKEGAIVSKNVRLYGIGESAAEALLKELMLTATNPTVAPYAKDGEVLLRVTALAPTVAKAEELCALPMGEIERLLGEYIYGIDVPSLWSVTVDALIAAGKKVATAESCTGGMLGELITSVPGSSACYECGIVSYANCIKERILNVSRGTLERFGAVSEEVAREMARGVRELSGADIGVSITGVAGPDGGTEEKPVGRVFVACDDGKACVCRKLTIGRGAAERELVRHNSCLAALDLVRRCILSYNK